MIETELFPELAKAPDSPQVAGCSAMSCSPWTMEELEEIIAHAELYSNYPRSGFNQMTSRQKEVFEEIWRRNVEKANLEENAKADPPREKTL